MHTGEGVNAKQPMQVAMNIGDEVAVDGDDMESD